MIILVLSSDKYCARETRIKLSSVVYAPPDVPFTKYTPGDLQVSIFAKLVVIYTPPRSKCIGSFLGVGGISPVYNGQCPSGESFQLISGTKCMAIVFAYDLDDVSKYCSALVYVGSDPASNFLMIIAKQESGMTIEGGYWGYVNLTTVSGHNIKYNVRYLMSV